MALNAYLKLDGIKGESTDDKHKDEIDVLSFSWGLTQPATSGGSSTGKVSQTDFTFTIKVDKASPLLYKACASGQHIKSATLTVRKAGSGQQEYIKYKFTDILISGFQPVTRTALTGIIGEDSLKAKQGGVPGAIAAVGAAVTPSTSDEVATAAAALRAKEVEYSVLDAGGEWTTFNFDFEGIKIE